MFFKKNYKASFNTLDSEGVSSSLPGMAQRERSHLREGSTRGTRCRLAKDMPALLGPVSTTEEQVHGGPGAGTRARGPNYRGSVSSSFPPSASAATSPNPQGKQ